LLRGIFGKLKVESVEGQGFDQFIVSEMETDGRGSRVKCRFVVEAGIFLWGVGPLRRLDVA
jgi:hypothetical protein